MGTAEMLTAEIIVAMTVKNFIVTVGNLSWLIMIVGKKVLDWRVSMSEMKEYESARFLAEVGLE